MAITGLLLAGGQGSRMNGVDKGLVPFQDALLYQHGLTRLVPQVDQILISANRNITQYSQSGYPVIQDRLTGYQGPLAGILAGLEHCPTEWLVTIPCDTPFIPLDLVQRLYQSKTSALCAFAHDGYRPHPTLALFHVSLKTHLSYYLDCGERKILLFLQQQLAHCVDFSDQPGAFKNINTPDDCLTLQG